MWTSKPVLLLAPGSLTSPEEASESVSLGCFDLSNPCERDFLAIGCASRAGSSVCEKQGPSMNGRQYRPTSLKSKILVYLQFLALTRPESSASDAANA